MQYRFMFDTVSMMPLHHRIDRIYDHLFANASIRTPSGIGFEVGKLLHAAVYLETMVKHVPAFNLRAAELTQLWRGDTEWVHEFAESVREVYHRMNESWNLYDSSSDIALGDFDICATCAYLNGVVVSDKKQDILGEAVEAFRSQLVKQVGGQFFTDARVTYLAMPLLAFDPREGDDLIDICAGTGGFLLAGLNHIAQLLEVSKRGSSHESQAISLACSSLAGQEIDPEVCEAANSTLRSRLGARGSKLVERGDSLSPDGFSREGRLRFGAHLCAASNPPFGTKITVKDPSILRHFELAEAVHARPTLFGRGDLVPQPPDILFLERNLGMLVPGKGRVAIVLPYQILSGPKALFVRQWLLRNAYLKAVIDLPPETFQPYTGTKTALLVAQRRDQPLNDPRKSEDYEVFMSMPRWIGHDRRGNPVYKRNTEGKPTNEILTDFHEVEQAHELYQGGQDPFEAHDGSFRVRFSSIASDPLLRINALFHRPALRQDVGLMVGGMPSSTTTVKLRELVKDIFYPGRFKRNYVDYFPGAVPFLGGSNVGEFLVRTDKWLSPDDVNLTKLRISRGWILITRSGTTGITSLVPGAWEGFAMSEHVIRVVPDETKCPPEYLLAFLRSHCGQEQLARGVFGSVIDEINPEHVGNIDVDLPSREAMEEIARLVRTAEMSRQSGIENYHFAMEKMNALFPS